MYHATALAVQLSGLTLEAYNREWLRWLIKIMEYLFFRLDQKSRELGHLVYLVKISDWAGMGSRHLWRPGLSLFSKGAKLLQGHYCEGAAWLVNVNMPAVFTVAYAVVKLVLNPNTIRKSTCAPVRLYY